MVIHITAVPRNRVSIFACAIVWTVHLLHQFCSVVVPVSAFLPHPSPQRRAHPYFKAPLLFERVPRPNERGPPQGGDMAYIQDNIERQAELFLNIRNVGDPDCVNDVYARDPKQTTYWYIGKVARCTGTVSLNQAIARQLNLMEEHAVRLRPVELSRSFGSLQFWTAPGDSETECAQNDPNVLLTCMERYVEGTEDVTVEAVGFDCQVVTNQGVGFHLVRRDDGTVPPELILPSSTGEFE